MTTDKSHAERARELAEEVTKLATEATPGPWSVIPDPGETVKCDDCGSLVDSDDFPHMIARGPDEIRANRTGKPGTLAEAWENWLRARANEIK